MAITAAAGTIKFKGFCVRLHPIGAQALVVASSRCGKGTCHVLRNEGRFYTMASYEFHAQQLPRIRL